MNQQPTATGMITVYNDEDRIARAVESLLNQTFENLEIVVIDDGSNDRTSEILDRFSDPRLRIFHVDRIGRAASLALAVEHARGEYIANLDADDEAYPDRVARQCDFLQHNRDHAWVGGGEERWDAQRNEHYYRLYPTANAEIRRMAVRCIPYCHSAVMFRKSVIDDGINYDPRLPFLIDFDFFLRVAMKHRVANLATPVVKRTAHSTSYFQRTFSTFDQNRELSRLCRRARQEFRLPLWMDIYPAARAGYPLLPNFIKNQVRKRLGLKESNVATPFVDSKGSL